MRSIDRVPEPESNISSRLDGVQMDEQDRAITKAYLNKIEAAVDLVAVASAAIRAAFARNQAVRSPSLVGKS